MDAGGFARRAGRHLAWRARRIRTLAADRIRRGDRTVIMTPPAGLRFGNWLYLWLDAHVRTSTGQPTFVLEAPGMEMWLEAVPALRPLTIAREQLRFHDRREWDDESWNQRFGVDFSRAQLHEFARTVLAPALPLEPAHDLVVNVRRGDYYSDPGHRARYGFDQIAYIAEAMERVGHVERASVVSDDPAWCRENLDAVIRPWAHEVSYDPQNPLANFQAVCTARRLIGTNSTFSYWGGYVSDATREDAVVVMPRFHGRLDSGPDAYQLDPDWIIIDGHH